MDDEQKQDSDAAGCDEESSFRSSRTAHVTSKRHATAEKLIRLVIDEVPSRDEQAEPVSPHYAVSIPIAAAAEMESSDPPAEFKPRSAMKSAHASPSNRDGRRHNISLANATIAADTLEAVEEEPPSPSRAKELQLAARTRTTTDDVMSAHSGDKRGPGPAAPRSQMNGGSVHSSHNTVSSQGYNTALDRIRQVLLSGNDKLEPSMFWLRTAVQVTFLVILVMSIVGFAVMKSSMTDLQKSVHDISDATELANTVVGVRKSTRSLNLVNRGLLPASVEEIEFTNIRRIATSMAALHHRLYLQMEKLSPELKAVYHDPTIMTEVLVESVVTTQDKNFWTTMSDLVANAYLLGQRPLSEITESNPQYFFIAENTRSSTPLWHTLLRLTTLYVERAEADAKRVENVQTSLMAIALALLLVMVLGFFPPAIKGVNRTRDSVFHMFMDIPFDRVSELANARSEQMTELGLIMQASSKFYLLHVATIIVCDTDGHAC
jgi:hypothetical protein